MKNLLVLCAFLATTTLFAQTVTFEKVLAQQLSLFASNNQSNDWQVTSQTLKKIAQEHPNQWIAHYYVSYAYMQLAGTYEDQTMEIVAEYLDQAQTALDQANQLTINQSELLVLQGFIYLSRIWESPYLNGGLYGRKIGKLFRQAVELDPKNPRAYYLKGLLTYHTPRFVGGGKERAKPWLATAKKKFESFHLNSTIMPHWGQLANEELWEECGGGNIQTTP